MQHAKQWVWLLLTTARARQSPTTCSLSLQSSTSEQWGGLQGTQGAAVCSSQRHRRQAADGQHGGLTRRHRDHAAGMGCQGVPLVGPPLARLARAGRATRTPAVSASHAPASHRHAVAAADSQASVHREAAARTLAQPKQPLKQPPKLPPLPCRRRVTRRPLVEVAHMELAEPTIEQAVARCVAAGASRVIVAPYFLSRGRHVQVSMGGP